MALIARLHLSDKVLHWGGYAVLAFLPALHERLRTAILAILALAAVGVLLEFAQLHVEGRSFEILDMAADGGGLLCGFAAGLPWRRLFRSG
jgi:VanZ family protein